MSQEDELLKQNRILQRQTQILQDIYGRLGWMLFWLIIILLCVL